MFNIEGNGGVVRDPDGMDADDGVDVPGAITVASGYQWGFECQRQPTYIPFLCSFVTELNNVKLFRSGPLQFLRANLQRHRLASTGFDGDIIVTDPDMSFEPQIVAILAPDDDDDDERQVEVRIAQEAEELLRLQMEDGEVIVAAEVDGEDSSSNLCGWKKPTWYTAPPADNRWSCGWCVENVVGAFRGNSLRRDIASLIATRVTLPWSRNSKWGHNGGGGV